MFVRLVRLLYIAYVSYFFMNNYGLQKEFESRSYMSD